MKTFLYKTGLLAEPLDGRFPGRLRAWDGRQLRIGGSGTSYGYVERGPVDLETAAGRFRLQRQMYFCVPGPFRIEGEGRGLVVERTGYMGFFMVGGPIETHGRLRYINGCTDSLLIPPVQLGDPCLNLLHFPPGVDQTAHTHPSVRIGIVARGNGICRTSDGEVALTEGTIFVIPVDELHAFTTKGDSMTVIAWHPDSDCGPTDENHPMFNRTIVNGVPANLIGKA